MEFEAKLLDFNIGMLTTINKFNTFIPVTLREEIFDNSKDKNFILSLKYIQNKPTDDIASELKFHFVNKSCLMYLRIASIFFINKHS